MERRKYPRAGVNLTAAIVNGKDLPIGCRILDVSTGGMLLRHDRDDRSTALRESHDLEVRISLKDDDTRKVIRLPITIVREEATTLGARFATPQPQLMKLLEPYLQEMDQDEPVVSAPREPVVPAREAAVHTPEVRSDASSEVRVDTAALRPQATRPQRQTDENRKLFILGLVILGVVVLVLLFNMVKISVLSNRVAVLESNTGQPIAIQPDAGQAQASTEHLDKRLDQINSRLDSLVALNTSLETRMQHLEDAPKSQPETRPQRRQTAPVKTAEASVASAPVVTASRTAPLTTPATTPTATRESKAGDWVINLMTLYDETAAQGVVTRAHDRGVQAHANTATIRGTQAWRIQVTGFDTRAAARTYSVDVMKKLGLKSVWIFRQ